MARKPPPEHTRFKKGQSGNPSGRRRFSLSIDKLREIIDRFQGMTRSELQSVMSDQKTTMIELQVGSIIAKAAKDGDYNRMAALLDRLLGKVPQVILDEELALRDDLKEMPRPELLKLIKSELEKESGGSP